MKIKNKTLTALISLMPEILTIFSLVSTWWLWTITQWLYVDWFYTEFKIMWFLTIILLIAWVIIWWIVKDKYRKRMHAKESSTSYWKKKCKALEEYAEQWDKIIWTLSKKFTDDELLKMFPKK